MGMRIAIIEDDPAYAQEIEGYARRFGQEEQTLVEVTRFADGSELLNQYDHKWDLLLMDIEMPHLDGMFTARCIREKDPDVLIIFITNLAQFAIQGYEVHALDYVLKPVSYYSLAMKLRKAMRVSNRKTERALMISQEREMVRVPIANLLYIEVYNHSLCYHTMDGDIVTNGGQSLSALEEELAGAGFARCHNGYLVNLRYVDAVQGNVVRIAGQELPTSRNRRKEFLEAMLQYMKGETRK